MQNDGAGNFATRPPVPKGTCIPASHRMDPHDLDNDGYRTSWGWQILLAMAT